MFGQRHLDDVQSEALRWSFNLPSIASFSCLATLSNSPSETPSRKTMIILGTAPLFLPLKLFNTSYRSCEWSIIFCRRIRMHTKNISEKFSMTSTREDWTLIEAAYWHAFLSNEATTEAMEGSWLPGPGWLTSAPSIINILSLPCIKNLTNDHERHSFKLLEHRRIRRKVYTTQLRIYSGTICQSIAYANICTPTSEWGCSGIDWPSEMRRSCSSYYSTSEIQI